MKGPLFLSFCLSLTLGLLSFYSAVQEHFSDPAPYFEKMAELRDQVEAEKLQKQLLTEKYKDFKTEVALILKELPPSKMKGAQAYPLRNLASVVGSGSNEKFLLSISQVELKRAKKAFAARDYSQARQKLTQLWRRASHSANGPEILFLLMESQYQLGEFESSSQSILQLVELFPKSDLTAYSLLRFGRILETEGRFEEALDIYQMVSSSFALADVKAQAQREALRLKP